jgi:hypothetical protein
MNTAEAQLSSELQELYLENKETLSDILFLEDESRFFQKLFDKVLLSPIKEEKFQQIEFVNSSLLELQNRRDKLKSLLTNQQLSIESMLKNADMKIGLSLIDQNTIISAEIKALLNSDKLVKKELYALVEPVLADRNAGHLLNE